MNAANHLPIIDCLAIISLKVILAQLVRYVQTAGIVSIRRVNEMHINRNALNVVSNAIFAKNGREIQRHYKRT